MTTQRRAKVGGEYGKNGEWYEGGKFIANTDRAKGQPKANTRRQEVAPYKWEVSPTGYETPIWRKIDNYITLNNDVATLSKDQIQRTANAYNWKMDVEKFAEELAPLVEKWNAGERWII